MKDPGATVKGRHQLLDMASVSLIKLYEKFAIQFAMLDHPVSLVEDYEDSLTP